MPDNEELRIKEKDINLYHHFVPFFDDFFEGLHLLTSAEFKVFAVLRKFANHRTGEAWPSVSTICKITGLTDPTVRKSLKSMEEKGCISVKRRYNPEKKQYNSSLYTVFANPQQWKVFQEERKENIKKMPAPSDLVRQNQSTPDETDKVVYIQEKDTISNNSCQSPEQKYDMEWVKNHYDYEALIDVVDRSDADMLMNYIYDIINSQQKTMSIEGTPLSSDVVIKKILDLGLDDLEFVLGKFKSTMTEIRNTKAYLRTIMYNAKSQSRAEIQNSLHRDNVI